MNAFHRGIAWGLLFALPFWRDVLARTNQARQVLQLVALGALVATAWIILTAYVVGRWTA